MHNYILPSKIGSIIKTLDQSIYGNYQIVPLTIEDGLLRDALLIDKTSSKVLATVEAYKLNFRGILTNLSAHLRKHFTDGIYEGVTFTKTVVPIVRENCCLFELPLDEVSSRCAGNVRRVDQGLLFNSKSDETDAEISFQAEFATLIIHYYKNPWMGEIEVIIDGRVEFCDDCFISHETNLVVSEIIANSKKEQHQVVIRTTKKKNEASKAHQLLLKCVYIDGPDSGKSNPLVKGSLANPFPDDFINDIAHLAENARIIDVGGGKRQLPDARYLNVEYEFSAFPDVFGDGQSLPFENCTFDYVLSQAVIEHVPNPFAAASELIRIAKPGAIINCEIAFMQPLHCRPYHFFNVTPWGAELLFKDCSEVQVTTHGDFSHLFSWVNKYVSDFGSLGIDKTEQLYALLSEFDALATNQEKANFAPSVKIRAIK
jgi:SAM-dependent methyltransferase